MRFDVPARALAAAAAAGLALAGWVGDARAQSVNVVEYYNATLDSYFITGRSNEQALLDALTDDFRRTGMQFTAIAAAGAGGGDVRICRFYISVTNPLASTHFYGREGIDCESILAQNLPGFSYEGFDFAVMSPQALGVCPSAAPVRIYRSFRAAANGRTANHRYSASRSSAEALAAAGWTSEGVAFCVSDARDATIAPQTGVKRVVSGASPFDANCSQGQGGTVYVGAEVEPHIAMNPGNPLHLLASWQQDRWSNGAARGTSGAVSFDGGNTWQPSRAPFSRCGGGTIATASDYERATDPWAAIGPDGVAYQMALSLSGAAFSSNSISAMLVARSADGGRTWGTPATLIRDTGAAAFNDKNMMVVDPRDPRYVYAVWGRLRGDGNGPAWFARSINNGNSWEPARSIYNPAFENQTFGNLLLVMPDGSLVNVFMDIIRTATPESAKGSFMRLVRSSDRGVTWSAPITVAEFFGIGVRDPVTGLAVRDGVGLPSAAVGPDGRLHMVWQDSRFSQGARDGIAYSSSADAGLTWSGVVRVNARGDVPAFSPTVSVRDDGTIGVSYFDLRAASGSSAGLATSYRLATSARGVTWRDAGIEDSFDITQAPFANGWFLGDYHGLVSNGSSFSALYARSGADANNRTDIVFARLAEGSLKSHRPAHVAVGAGEFVASPALRQNVAAAVERTVLARRPGRDAASITPP